MTVRQRESFLELTVGEESRKAQISAVAALDGPTRRRLYDHVVRRSSPISRDEAAAALGLPRRAAAFHLDRLVDEDLLDVIYQRRRQKTTSRRTRLVTPA
jgi:predicted ArsR family transcriptional regulator